MSRKRGYITRVITTKPYTIVTMDKTGTREMQSLVDYENLTEPDLRGKVRRECQDRDEILLSLEAGKPCTKLYGQTPEQFVKNAIILSEEV